MLLSRSTQGTATRRLRQRRWREFEQELLIDPSNANAAYEIGESLRKAGQLDKAIESFTKAVESYPEFEEALVGLGRTLVAAGQSRAAVPHLKKAISLNPGDEVAFYQIAQAHRALGQEAEQQAALAEFERLRREKERQGAAVPPGQPNVTKQGIDPIRRQ